MSLYEYKCPKCKKELEKIGKYEDKVKCPECKEEMIRLISSSSTHFKGGGWTPKFHKR